jgi:zinc protease
VAGRTIADIESWPDRISKVTLEDVKEVAARYFDPRRSVTGTLLAIPPDVVHQTGASAPQRRS